MPMRKLTEGQAQADGRRAELFGRWIAALRAKDDAAGVATVYAAYATDVTPLAHVRARMRVLGIERDVIHLALGRAVAPNDRFLLCDVAGRRWSTRARPSVDRAKRSTLNTSSRS